MSKNKMWESVDPLSEWKKGIWGWIHRNHSLVLQVLVETGLAAFVWNRFGWRVGIGVAFAVLPSTAFVLREKRYWIRELQTGSDFHRACHFMRDEVAQLRRLARQEDQGQYVYAFGEVHDKLCERIARYFQSATNDTTVVSAIRLAASDGNGVSYKTVGRSSGMSERRKECSVAIPVDRGLARTLRDHNNRGVCHIRDIGEAVRMTWWMGCPSDKFEDVKVVLAAPINWYDAKGDKVMGGILYVASRRDNLKARHIEPIKAFADLLGFVYPSVTGKPQYEETSSAHAAKS